MTVANTLRRAGPFTGDGVTTVFPFTFKVFAGTDVVVTELAIATNIETVKTLTTHYSVTLNPDQDTSPGGVVAAVAPPSASVRWTLSSAVPAVQGSALSTGGGFYPEVIEAALDKLTIVAQELQELTGRTLVTPISTPIGATLPSPEANKAIAWNGAADNLQNVTLGGAGAVSTFMEPVILAVDSADARTQLTAAKSGTNSDITSLAALTTFTRGATRVYTSVGVNVWAKPAGLKAVRVRVQAAGGGGAGALGAAAQMGVGSGGGGGGYSEKFILAASLGATENATVGAAGAAGSSAPSNGGVGGTTSFGAHCSATGGNGGGTLAAGTSATPGGAIGIGGSGSGGDVNCTGGVGGLAYRFSGTVAAAGSGGAAVLGGGGGGAVAGGGGIVGGNYGGGGGGGNSDSTTGRVGGAGGAAVIIVEEFY